jgi:hypothetical protein
MPLTAKKIQERTSRATFSVAGEPFWIEYRSALAESLTQEILERWQEEANACETQEEAHRYLAGIVCQFLTAWDAYESIAEDGTLGPMLPLDVDHIASLDDGFLARCLGEMARDAAQVKVGGTA